MSQPTIESILHEQRLFQPSPEFSKKAHIKNLEEYQQLYDQANSCLANLAQEVQVIASSQNQSVAMHGAK